MAPITTKTSVLLGLVALASSKPVLQRRQDEEVTSDDPLSGLNTDVDWWCTSRDVLDPESMRSLWEDEIPDVGGSLGDWLSRQAEFFTEGEPNDEWAANTLLASKPGAPKNEGIAGCGTPGSHDCAPIIDCEDFVERGFGTHYWALKSLQGFHDKLSTAHEYLQDETLETLMSLSEISADFTKPSTWTTEDGLYAALGAIFYFIGGVSGFASMGASRFAASALSRPGTTKAAQARVQPSIDKLAPGPQKDAMQKRLDDSIETANAMAQKASQSATEFGNQAAALGAATYLVGGIFGVAGIGPEDPFGEVEPGDLEPVLKSIFSSARDNLEQLGRLASGRRDTSKGDEYAFLPGQHPSDGDYPVDNDIAKLFHGGGMLLGTAHPAFNDTLEAAFSTMKPRIVDQALVTGKFFAFADEEMETEERCKDFAETGDGDHYPWRGSQWIGGKYCMRLMRDAGTEQLCENQVDRCQYFVATDDDYDKLQAKYGFNMVEYFESALDCTLNGGEEKHPELFALNEDGAYPTCWFGLPARKGLEDCGIYTDGPQSCSIDFHDF